RGGSIEARVAVARCRPAISARSVGAIVCRGRCRRLPTFGPGCWMLVPGSAETRSFTPGRAVCRPFHGARYPDMGVVHHLLRTCGRWSILVVCVCGCYSTAQRRSRETRVSLGVGGRTD